MADTKVEIQINAKDNASKVFKDVASSAAGLAQELAVGVVAGTAAMAAGLGVAVKSAADFQQQMSAVAAVSGATGEEMAQLTDKALELGQKTSFSASEAAKGLEELVKGGVTIPEIMNGAAEATLNLAAAGGVDLASAAEIASNALNTFNLSGEDMAHVADMIAGAANSSAIDVNDFKLSLAAAGSVVALAGGTFDDLSVAITAMGNAGIKGSDAGTSLKTMLMNLQPTTKEQTALFKELGITTADGSNKFFDASGKMRSFADVGQVLQDALRGMTDQQRLATLETMFGSDAIRAAAVFTEQGAEGFTNLAAQMGKVTAEAVAAQRLDNLNGDLEKLGGTAETAGIKLGNAFQGPLRGAVQAIDKFINENVIPFIDTYGPGFAQAVSDAGSALVTGAGNLLDASKNAAQNGLQVLADKLAETGPKFAPWASDAGEAGKAVDSAFQAASKGVQALQLALQGNFPGAMKTGTEALEDLGKAGSHAGKGVDEARVAIEKLSTTKSIMSDTAKAFDLFGRSVENVSKFLPNLIGNILGVGGASATAGEQMNIWGGVFQVIISPITSFLAQMQQLTANLVKLGEVFNAVGEIIRVVGTLFATPEKSMQTLGIAADILGAAFSALGTTVSESLAGVDAAVATLQTNIRNALSTAAANVWGQASQIGINIIAGIRNGITSTAGSITSAVTTAANNALAAAKSALGIASPSKEFYLVGLEIDEGMADGIEEGASAVEEAITEVVDTLEEAVPDAVEQGMNLGQAVADAIGVGLGKQETAKLAVDKLKGTVAGEMRDLAAEIEDIVSTTTDKFAEIGTKAGEAIAEAMKEARDKVADTIADTNDRITDMLQNLTSSRTLRAIRDAFGEAQDEAARARSRGRETEDLERDRAKEDAKWNLELSKELGKAKTAEERTEIIQRAVDARRALTDKRNEEDAEIAYRRKRADEDRAYQRKQEEERRRFEDGLESAALQKSINRTIEERDAKIKAIGEALAEKERKINEDAAKEQAKLIADSQKKIQILKDEFIAKLPPLTAQAKTIVDTFLAGIDIGLLTVANLANNAIKAIAQIPRQVNVTVTTTQQTANRTPQLAPTSNVEPAKRGPLMDEGGVVRGPSWVEVGPGVREAFIPLNKGTGVPSATINLSVYGTVVTPRDLVDAIHDGLLQKKRGLGTLGLS